MISTVYLRDLDIETDGGDSRLGYRKKLDSDTLQSQAIYYVRRSCIVIVVGGAYWGRTTHEEDEVGPRRDVSRLLFDDLRSGRDCG